MTEKAHSHPDRHDGKRPTDLPAYGIPEAANYLCLPRATVYSWVTRRPYRAGNRIVYSEPLVLAADHKHFFLSFLNLVELHVVSSIRRGHGVKPRPLRRAIDYLKKTFHSQHPLLDQQMLTDGKSLFIERYGEYVNISEDGQLQMKIALDAYLSRIEWDESGIPIRLFPFTRGRIENSPRLIAIDPRIRFGKPCITGTRVPTGIIGERHKAGDSIAHLAEDYGRTSEEIEEAVRYESRTAA